MMFGATSHEALVYSLLVCRFVALFERTRLRAFSKSLALDQENPRDSAPRGRARRVRLGEIIPRVLVGFYLASSRVLSVVLN